MQLGYFVAVIIGFLAQWLTSAWVVESAWLPDRVTRTKGVHRDLGYLDEDRKSISRIVRRSPQPDILPEKCGLSPFLEDKVVRGQPANRKDWPWMAAIFVCTSGSASGCNRHFICGGTLVTKKHVISAAHCFSNENRTQIIRIPAESIIVRLGEHDISSDDDGATPKDFTVEQLIEHPQFTRRDYINDIAILKLDETVSFSDDIFPACLPYKPEVREDLSDLYDREGYITGWGATDGLNKNQHAAVLQYAQVSFYGQDDCEDVFMGSDRTIHKSHICAENKETNADTCTGDSGGPVVLGRTEDENLVYYLVGVTSFGDEICRGTWPGIYTRITSHIEWIINNLK